jgi:hypothetical protein
MSPSLDVKTLPASIRHGRSRSPRSPVRDVHLLPTCHLTLPYHNRLTTDSACAQDDRRVKNHPTGTKCVSHQHGPTSCRTRRPKVCQGSPPPQARASHCSEAHQGWRPWDRIALAYMCFLTYNPHLQYVTNRPSQ